MAPKRFFTGATTSSIRSTSMVSAKMLPMTKAPKAELKPTAVEIHAMAQQRPSATMTSVSSVMSLRVALRNVGTTYSPTTNHNTKKKPMRTSDPSICPPSGLLPLAMADSITIITMARMSSRMRTLITSRANDCCKSPMSSNAL